MYKGNSPNGHLFLQRTFMDISEILAVRIDVLFVTGTKQLKI